MVKSIGVYPSLRVDAGQRGAVGLSGGVLLTRAAKVTGLAGGLVEGLSRWDPEGVRHGCGKVLLDLAVMLVAGGTRAHDLSVLRCEPEVFGRVASDASVSRVFDRLAGDINRVEKTVAGVLAGARATAWGLAGEVSPMSGASIDKPVVVDLDATLLVSHSEKQGAAPTWKKGFGFHPLTAWIDHGKAGSGEAAGIMLRAGNAGSNTAEDHIRLTRAALKQLPIRAGKQVLVRTDSAGGTHEYLDWLARQHVQYSVGFTLPGDIAGLVAKIPEDCWYPAIEDEVEQEFRKNGQVAELGGLMNLEGWPAGMRVIVRRERPHPGAQLRLTDADGYRLTAFATNTRAGQLAILDLRHRRRARCEDRIRNAKDTGLARMPYQQFDRNRVWCLVVQIANALQAWMAMLGLPGHEGRVWEPKTIRYRLLNIPAVIARTGRRVWLHLKATHPWTHLAIKIWTALARHG